MFNASHAPDFALRRASIKAIAGAICLLGFGRQTIGAAPIGNGDARLRAQIAGLFRDEAAVCAVGRHCLAGLAVGEHGALERMRVLLAPITGDAQFRERLARQRRREFASGDTTIVNGWVLARSETDLCVALALLPRD